MEQKRVYIEYRPEHHSGDVTITIHCKKSEAEKYDKWFKTFIKQRELDLEVLNSLVLVREKKGD